ncbi:hypothetical protein CWB73_18900 [Pseudoalteromonas phenolica]|uniref:Uncharacterized protein n=1 Tax=Pseudoalteromonas phenolica TaxID=161398 RepID=A0A5R9Q048_9GAMM|nr:LiaF domain-containing protein [Pseudoalteromonas phenolica]TLX46204.1 hypothetical protein C1E24_15695 [Pseudoalteromonas phenolica]TMN90570.1 hypothetical protein CWB72_08505 [Pseudoalteromonas phenolica]TMP77724.1 hypothetical protein CWB73_18900 [Pseudoalteromonas phenolica]|tara:strand:- start:1831 stop:2496 length:666 start_codon:yes stop_codon:yes gene_type:complete
MSVVLEDRPIEQVREEVIDNLIYNYSHGVISAEAFERRLDKAMSTQVHAEIVALTADLTMQADEKYTAQKDASLNINYGQKSAGDKLDIKTVLGNSSRTGKWAVPKEINLLNVLGSTTLDFSDAVFEHQEVTVNVNCILGSEKILIPEGVNVICEAFCILGNVENKAPSIAPKQAPTIKIKGKLWLGSVDVEIKRTIKEKFVSFANELKSLFDDGSYGKYK